MPRAVAFRHWIAGIEAGTPSPGADFGELLLGLNALRSSDLIAVEATELGECANGVEAIALELCTRIADQVELFQPVVESGPDLALGWEGEGEWGECVGHRSEF